MISSSNRVSQNKLANAWRLRRIGMQEARISFSKGQGGHPPIQS